MSGTNGNGANGRKGRGLAPPRPPRRTYWHLEGLRRKPTDYDIATSRLLYHPERGFAVAGSAADWYRRHQRGSPLTAGDWDQFRDPRATTYTSYVDRQRTGEAFLDGLVRAADDGGARGLPAPWLEVCERLVAPLRYPVHGLSMAASYLGSMAPSGRIAVVALFQVGDELRRVQRLAFRLRQLQELHPGFGDDSRLRWERAPEWQPWREVIEHLLATYDWGEAFAGLCLAIKPAFDELFLGQLGRRAAADGDGVLAGFCFSLGEDAAWHRDWAAALVRLAITDRADNRARLGGWIARWQPRAAAAVAAIADALGDPRIAADVDAACRRYWSSLELEVP